MNLSQLTAPDRLNDSQGHFCFHQQLVTVEKTEVCEDVATASDGSFAASPTMFWPFASTLTWTAKNDPTDPNHMVIGWRQFNTIASDFRQAGYGYTTDGGQTWTFPGVIEPGIFRSDPVLHSDVDGNIYYNSLTLEAGDFLCDVFRSTEGGASWDAGTFAQGGDKQWMTIDKTSGPGAGHIYAAWNSFFSSCPPGFFTRSIDGSEYESCITIPEEPFWGTLAVGPGGALYVVGTDGNEFVVARSSSAKLESIATPCSVKAYGGWWRPPQELEVPNWYLKFANS